MGIGASQSALLMSMARFDFTSKSRKSESCDLMPSTLNSICSFEKEWPFWRFAAGVANHARTTAYKGDWCMPVLLQSRQPHNG